MIGQPISFAPISARASVQVLADAPLQIEVRIGQPLDTNRVIRAGVSVGKRYTCRVRLVPRFEATARATL